MIQTNNAAMEAAPETEDVPESPTAGDDASLDPRESATITMHPRADRSQQLRILEAVLFASA